MPASDPIALLCLLSLAACTAAEPTRTSSQPVSSTPAAPQSVSLSLGEEAPPTIDAVPPEVLGEVFPDLAALPELPRLHAVGALNLVPAPCPPCWGKDSLARCALAPPDGCENLTGLVERASRMAAAGTEVEDLRAALSYADVWFAPAPDAQDPAAVDIEVWIEPASPFVELTLARVAEVEAAAPDLPLRWRWQAIPDPEHPALSAALARAAAQGRGREWLSALQGIDAVAIQAANRAAGVSEEGPAGQVQVELMRTKDVRSSPTWFVEGYRLRGLQSARELVRVAVLEQGTLEKKETP